MRAAGPFVMLAVMAGWMAAAWNSIPARFPVHEDLHGNANAWSDKSVSSVFGLLMLAAGILALLTAVDYLKRHGEGSPAGAWTGLQYGLGAILGLTSLRVTGVFVLPFAVIFLLGPGLFLACLFLLRDEEK